MQQYFAIFLIALPTLVLGQQDSSQKLVDSLTTELKETKAILSFQTEEAKRLEYRLAAKEMALRSTELNDTIFQSLLAVQAHNFWVNNKGDFADIDIYRGLYNALVTLDDPLIKSLPVSIGKMDNRGYATTTMMANKLCSQIKRNMLLTEWEKFAMLLPYERTCQLTMKK